MVVFIVHFYHFELDDYSTMLVSISIVQIHTHTLNI